MQRLSSVIDYKSRNKKEETLENIIHPKDMESLNKCVSHPVYKFGLVFLFDSSMEFSKGYFEVINVLAREYPEILFVSMDFINQLIIHLVLQMTMTLRFILKRFTGAYV